MVKTLMAWTGIISLVIATLGYVVKNEKEHTRLEAAFQLSERVNNLESLLFPILVELRVREKMQTVMVPAPAPKPEPPKPPAEEAQPKPVVVQPKPINPAAQPPRPYINQSAAKEWAQREIQRANPKFRMPIQ